MPSYDYRCEANQQIYEVRHSMSERAQTWAELCELGGLALVGVDPNSKVTRLISGGGVVNSASLKNPEAPPCMSGGGCPGGRCGG
ncbi:hypothetical protein [Aliagarivorans taiwanensis]|uniref:hypothetical protein n=1 Tax=Aliagarivorans taiwanensis TaxID=561966 RepID=UPI00042797DC|nr:hypothetical protein [Aliagarivorans taiwanensis]